jgi:hypothetical protein
MGLWLSKDATPLNGDTTDVSLNASSYARACGCVSFRPIFESHSKTCFSYCGAFTQHRSIASLCLAAHAGFAPIPDHLPTGAMGTSRPAKVRSSGSATSRTMRGCLGLNCWTAMCAVRFELEANPKTARPKRAEKDISERNYFHIRTLNAVAVRSPDHSEPRVQRTDRICFGTDGA